MRYFILFIVLGLAFVSCSKKSDKDLMKEADDFSTKNDFKKAAQIYEKIANEYPESESAPLALFNLGLFYQNKYFKDIDDAQSMQKSVDYYKMNFSKYPKNPKAPDAMFTAGYILSNELKNYNEATEIYNKLIKEYPSSQWIQPAKDELENMGLTPEQILERKLNAKKNI